MGASDATPRQRRPGARRRAREVALAALYRADLLGLDHAAALASLPEVLSLNDEEQPTEGRAGRRVRAEALEYAHDLITGLALDSATIDAAIAELAKGWSLERLSITDRNILRLGLWELTQDQPPAAVVNEAVEIARAYGGPDSARFVNGILGAWLERQKAGGAPSDAGNSEDTSE